jgi:kynureninase
MNVLDLRPDFSRFRAANPRRINLAAHSHHEWPDVSFEAQTRCWEDAARYAGGKWRVVFGEVLPAVQQGIAAILRLPDPSTIAVAPNTHELVSRLLSCFATNRAIRILSTDS